MSAEVIRIRVFGDDAHYEQLIGTGQQKDGPMIHFIREDPPADDWIEELPPSADTLVAIPLENVPFDLPEPWMKSALLPRLDPGYTILLHESDPATPVIRELQRPLRVDYRDEFARTQCENRFPHWVSLPPGAPADALVVPKRYWALHPGKGRPFHFDPAELIPPPGTGALCLLTGRDNTTLRRWASGIHDRTTMEQTNIERRLQQLKEESNTGGILCAYAERSDNGISVSALLMDGRHWRTVTRTLSSTAGAAEFIWQELLSAD